MPIDPDRRDRTLSRVAAACAVALLLPLLWPLVTGRVFLFDDLKNFHLPLRYLYANALGAGRLLLWTPAVYGGVYLHGEGQLGMLHPLHLVLYGLLPLQVAFNVELIANYVIAFTGMRWLLRRLGLRPSATLVGAMSFAFGGFQLLHHHHLNLVAVTAHMPWLLACEDLLITAGKPRDWAAGYAGMALVVGSELLLGFPQAVWWNVLAAAGFAVLRAKETGRWTRLVACGWAGVTGMLLGAAQLVPTLDAAAHSVRLGIDRSFALSYSLSPWNVFQLWSPRFFVHRAFAPPPEYLQVHELGIYSGTLLTIAPVWLAMRRHALGSHRLLVAGCAAFAGVMFVLALGSYGGLDVLLTYLPGLGSLRAPARYIVLVQFSLAIMAAVAFDDLVGGQRPAGWLTPSRALALSVFAAASVLTTVLFNTRILSLPAALPLASLALASRGTAAVAAVTIAFVLAARQMRGAAAVLILFTAVDLGWWGITYVYYRPAETIRAQVRRVPQPETIGMRVAASSIWADFPVMKGFEVVPGYLGLIPATTLPAAGDAFRSLAGAQASLFDDGALRPLGDAMPRARIVSPSGPEVTPGSTAVLVDDPGHIVVRMVSRAPGRLALTERFDAGWRAEIDGISARPMPVEGDFLGVEVEPGSHRVELRFRPRSFTVGIGLSVMGLLVLLVTALGKVRGSNAGRPADAGNPPPGTRNAAAYTGRETPRQRAR